jgi:hypothetical protein
MRLPSAFSASPEEHSLSRNYSGEGPEKQLKQRRVRLTDQVWAALTHHCVSSGNSANLVCSQLMRAYLRRGVKPTAFYRLDPSLSRSRRTLHIQTELWANIRAMAILDGFGTTSALVEYLLRVYLGMGNAG